MFTDTHSHIFNEYYDDIDNVIKEAHEVGVEKVIVSSTNYVNSKEIIELGKKYEEVFISLGVHPEDVLEGFDKVEKLLEENLDNKKLIAVGEIGLDYYYSKENKEKQIILFEKQLEFAEKHNLPVIVHSREATLDTITSLKKYNVRGVIHCFSGSIETAKEYIKMGFYIGVGGVVTFKNTNLKDVIKEIPVERILLETDSPYLSPEPYRGKQNSPKNVSVIANYISNLKCIEINNFSKFVEKNVNDLYGI